MAPLLGLTEEQTRELVENWGPEPDINQIEPVRFKQTLQAYLLSIDAPMCSVEFPEDDHADYCWYHACDLAELALSEQVGREEAEREIGAGVCNRPRFDRLRAEKLRWLAKEKYGITLD